MNKLIGNLQLSTGGHIFYYFNDEERYIENAVKYIQSGIEQDGYVLVIENERIYPVLYKKLKDLLTQDQLLRVHHVNNFDFYYLQGDFHAQTIVAYFSKIIEPYLKNTFAIKTWAHVEWGDLQEISCKIDEFEEEADKAVSSMDLLSVCAYDADRIPDTLKATLMTSHGYLMTDDDIIPC